MDDEVAMRVRDRVADLEEQCETRAEIRVPGVAVVGDHLPFDVLHHGVRSAIRCHAAVEQACDAGMIEPREDLALGVEAIDQLRRFAAGELERGTLLELPVGARGLVDLAHAAPADEAHDAPGAEACVGLQDRVGRVGHLPGCLRRILEETRGGLAGVQQAQELDAQLRIVAGRVLDVARALRRGQLQGGIEVPFELEQAFTIHDDCVCPVWPVCGV